MTECERRSGSKPAGGLVLRLSIAFVTFCAPLPATCQIPSQPSVTGIEVLISTESGVLGRPVSLNVGPDGMLFVVDQINSQVHRITADGTLLPPIGRGGSGPGEFKNPLVVEIDSNSFLVVDQRNGRIQEFGSDGAFLSTWPLPPFAAHYACDLGPNRRIAVTTLGRDSALAAVYDSAGSRIGKLGTPPTEIPRQIPMQEMRQQIARGRIPEFFRNTAFPHYGPKGNVWLNLITDGVVERYSEEGSLLFEYELDEPEMQGIYDAFVREHSDPDFRGLYALRYAADLYSTGEELWVLLNRADDEAVVVVRLSMNGERLGRVDIPEVTGAKLLAVDPERSKLFLAVPSMAEVIMVQLGG